MPINFICFHEREIQYYRTYVTLYYWGVNLKMLGSIVQKIILLSVTQLNCKKPFFFTEYRFGESPIISAYYTLTYNIYHLRLLKVNLLLKTVENALMVLRLTTK